MFQKLWSIFSKGVNYADFAPTPKVSEPVKAETPKARTRFTTGPDDLTDQEVAIMTSKGEILVCPDCQSELWEGPSGGMSVNMKCSGPSCGHKFNIACFGGGIAMAHRIDNRPSLTHDAGANQ